MINIMYLVLMALLALNVSAEVMNAFQTLDEGNQNSIATVNDQIDETQESLKDLLEDESKEKFRVLMPAIDQIRAEVQSFESYVTGIRDTLIDASGNNNGEVDPDDFEEKYGVTSPRGKKNKDVPTRLLVQGPNGQVAPNIGKGEELKQRIIDTRQRLVDIYTTLLQDYGTERFDLNESEVASRIQNIEENMPFSVDENIHETSNSKKVSWADYKFGHMPVAAVLPLLSQIRSDLKVSESNLVNDIVQLAGGKQIVFDRFFPVFQADKSYVIGGERLNATVSVGSYSSSLQPENIELRVNGQRLDIKDDGTADFSITASGQPGPRTIKTYVKVTNPLTGDVVEEDGEFTYEIGTRSVAVSADKMNVFYMGVDNPLTVAAAGVPSSSVRVRFGDAIQGSGSGNSYTVKGVRPTGNGTTDVTVTADGEVLGTFPFRVKPIPDPVPTMGGEQGGDIANSTFRAQRGVFAELRNFDFDARCNITGFQILYVPAREDALLATNAGGSFSGQAAALVGRARPGDNYTFKNIKAKCPGDAAQRDLGTMAFTIK
jgi:gliding motility-associated protein GldM